MTETTWTAKAIGKQLENAGYKTLVADHGYAVKVLDANDRQISIVWMPIDEPTPTGLGWMYLWGPTGDEHKAPCSTKLTDLTTLIVETLPLVGEETGPQLVLLYKRNGRFHVLVELPYGVMTACGSNAGDMERVSESEARDRHKATPCARCFP